MQNNYNTSIDFVFQYEGGYVNHPQDPGGPTNRGITLNTARAYWKKDASIADIKAMPKAVAEGIYKTQYADKINFDQILSGLDLCVLDAAVMSGPAKALKWLALDNTIDGYQALRLTFYKSLKIWSTFGKGWTNRLNACTTLAKKLSKNTIVDGLPPKADQVSNVPNEASLQPTAKKPSKITSTIATTTAAIAAGGLVTASTPSDWMWYVIAGTVAAVVAGYILIKYYQWRHAQVK